MLAPKLTSWIWGLFVLAILAVFFGFVSGAEAATYQLDLELKGGDSGIRGELDAEIGPEDGSVSSPFDRGTTWRRWNAEFTDDGVYLPKDNSVIKIWPQQAVPIQHVHVKFDVKGITNNNSATGDASNDTFFGAFRQPWYDHCDPDAPADMVRTNWGFEVEKWPESACPHILCDAVLVRGYGVTMMYPYTHGRNLYDWDPDEVYTIETDMNMLNNASWLKVTDSSGNLVLGLAPVTNPYQPADCPVGQSCEAIITPREGVDIDIGTWHNPYVGATISNLELLMEDLEGTQSWQIDGPTFEECEGNPPEDIDDPNNPYDTCACHAIPDVTAEPPCEDPINRSEPRKTSFLDPMFPFKFSGLSLQWNWLLDDLLNESNEKDEELAPMPEMGLQFAPPAPLPDSEVQVSTATMHFRTRMQNLYFGWCLVNDGLVYPMNSIVAGAQLLPELTEPDLTWLEGGCCQPITRVPDEDFDGDGMDDNWERLKFLGRSDYGYTTIEEVLPNDDPDADGYYANTFKNDDGEYLTVTPYLVTTNPSYPTYSTGGVDAKLTNLEEYILDTDPLNGDTDGDGYKDEMDFIGVGQIQMTFPIEKDPGPEGFYDVSATAVGINDVKKTSFVSAERRVFVGNEGVLKVNLQSSSQVITFGDDNQSVNLEVTLLQGEEDMEDLVYEWSFNNEPACPTFPELCTEDGQGGIGKSEITLGGADGIDSFSLPPPTGDKYPISVRVTSPVSGNETQASIELGVALPVNLTTAGCGGQTEEIDTLAAGDQTPVMVCVSEIAELTRDDVAALNFIWSKDGQVDREQSGLGKMQYALVPTKPAGQSHEINLIVKETATAEELVNASRTFAIEGPMVEIISPEPRSSDPISPEASRFISVESGQAVDLVAETSNFINREGYLYKWLVAGEEQEEESNNSQTTYTFQVPETAATGDSYNALIQVSNYSEDGMMQQAADSVALVVGEPRGQVGGASTFLGGLAAVFMTIPEIFRHLLIYAAIAAAVFFAQVFLYPKIPRSLLDKIPLGHKYWRGGYRSFGKNNLRREKKLAQDLRQAQRPNFRDED